MGHLRNMFFAPTSSGAGQKLRLAWGKTRRFYLGHLGKAYLEQQVAGREGQCRRCGTCCKLLYVCPHLEEFADGTSSCRIHEHRPMNCRIFPVDQADLGDRDLLNKGENGQSCGFHFGS